jgi:hypothetical protein
MSFDFTALKTRSSAQDDAGEWSRLLENVSQRGEQEKNGVQTVEGHERGD